MLYYHREQSHTKRQRLPSASLISQEQHHTSMRGVAHRDGFYNRSDQHRREPLPCSVHPSRRKTRGGPRPCGAPFCVRRPHDRGAPAGGQHRSPAVSLSAALGLAFARTGHGSSPDPAQAQQQDVHPDFSRAITQSIRQSANWLCAQTYGVSNYTFANIQEPIWPRLKFAYSSEVFRSGENIALAVLQLD